MDQMTVSASQTAIERITGPGLVVIVRLTSTQGLDAIAEAAIRGGAGAFEVTMNTPGALDWLPSARDRFGEQLLLGVGTVLEPEAATRAIDAGAQFVVAPDYNPAVVTMTKAASVLSIPGAFTPTEIMAAWRAGADIVKVFPAGVGGPRYLADVLAPLDHIPLFPTGGIDESNAADYIRAGATVIAAGASIVNVKTVGERRFDEMASRFRRMVEIIAETRGTRVLTTVGK